MADRLSADYLDATLERLVRRERRRNRDAAIRRTIVAACLAVVTLAAWRIFDRVMAREPLPVAWAVALAAMVVIVGLAFVVRGAVGRSRADMAREVDRRLGLHDRASAAWAVARGGVRSGLAAFVVRDAEAALRGAGARVDEAFPLRAERRVTAPVRRLATAALVVAVLALVAELLTVEGPFRLLPGIAKEGGAPTPDTPTSSEAPRRKGTGPQSEDGAKPTPPDAPPKPEDPKQQPPEGGIRVALKMTKEDYDADEPVTAVVAASATGEIRGARVFDVRISVDEPEADTGVRLEVDPQRPLGERSEIDLRKVPGLKLAPGEHVARARLTTRDTHEEHASLPVKFRVRPPKDDPDEKKGDSPPKPQSKPKPESQPGAPEEKKDETPAEGPPPPPPPALDTHVVVPLFGEGDLVKKKGLTLVLDPSGGTETPPARRPIGEALPEAKRRAEEAVDVARLSDADRELVRRYFELLESLRR